MIVFLSFAPIEFMGGAEKMIYKLATVMSTYEKVTVINANESLANMYGSIVLQKEFTDRTEQTKKNNSFSIIKIGFKNLIPFSKGWRKIRNELLNARLIYIKYEVLEAFFLFYFGGLGIRKRTVASLHSPLLYNKPQKFSDRLHTFVYSSRVNQFVLKNMKRIHVLNIRDEAYLTKVFHLKNVIRIPNSLPAMKVGDNNQVTMSKKKLSILFVGELSLRKGADILIQLIQNLSDEYVFSVAGDGPLQNRLITECRKKNNWKYYGFLHEEKLQNLYEQSDILFAPSRAEGLSLVMLEALSHGLKLVGYENILKDFSSVAKSPSKHNLAKEYESILKQGYINKRNHGYVQKKQKIINYFLKNFSDTKILPLIQKKVLQ